MFYWQGICKNCMLSHPIKLPDFVLIHMHPSTCIIGIAKDRKGSSLLHPVQGGDHLHAKALPRRGLRRYVEPLLKDTSEIRTPCLIRTLDWVPTLYNYILFSPWKKDTSLISTIISPSLFIPGCHGSGEEFGSPVGLYNKRENSLHLCLCCKVQESVLRT